MDLVPVEDRMNQVAATAPTVIGNVVESEINTDEESTSTEISKDTENSKYEEKREDYEAQGTAKIVGTAGSTTSSASAKSSDAHSVAEYAEGNRKEEEVEVIHPSEPPPESNGIESKETTPAPSSTPTTPQPSHVKPFEPIKPFEPLQPFEPPKSFEIAKKLEEPPRTEEEVVPTEEIEVNAEVSDTTSTVTKAEEAQEQLKVTEAGEPQKETEEKCPENEAIRLAEAPVSNNEDSKEVIQQSQPQTNEEVEACTTEEVKPQSSSSPIEEDKPRSTSCPTEEIKVQPTPQTIEDVEPQSTTCTTEEIKPEPTTCTNKKVEPEPTPAPKVPIAPQPEPKAPPQINATTQTQSEPHYQAAAFKNIPMNLLAEPPQLKVPLQPFQTEPIPHQTETKIYQPILRKSPTFVPVQEHSSSHKSEIKEEKIKNQLKEIISEIDTYAQKDRELSSVDGTRRINESEKRYNFEKYSSAYGPPGYGRNQKDTWVARLPTCLPTPPPRPCTLPRDFRTQPFYTQHSESYSSSTYASDYSITRDENISHPINLEKIFTPAHDAPQISPQKKIFASSDFYAKGFHPTIEEQVELARRISSSLSDATNQSSKGQSMYVNRKKRSVKWVHEGEGQANGAENGFGVEGHDENKPLLQLVMNPRGKLQDIYSLRKQGYSIDATLSPEFCQEIVRDLNSPRGKGAELFAKRRKKSEKWIVGETAESERSNYESPPTPKPILVPVLPPNHLPTPSYLPETAQRVQHNQKLDQIQEQFVRPRVKLIKSPWDAALETGSVDTAFEDLAPVWPPRATFVKPTVASYEQAMKTNTLESWDGTSSRHTPNPAYNSNSINRMVDHFQKGASSIDVYKPVLPRAWNSQPPPAQQYKPRAPSYKPEPPKEITTPFEIYNVNRTTPATPPPPPRKYGNFTNYNTAPRGWNQSPVYKPISFADYSDF